jgi:hypothetical protein
MFKFKAPKAMAKPFDINLITKLWVSINKNGLLNYCVSKYTKLAKIVIVLVLG